MPAVQRWASAENIAFKRHAADIQPKCADKIARLAASINARPLATVVLDAHGDQPAMFTGEVDGRLSERRVRAVRDALIAAGVAPARIFNGRSSDRQPLCRQLTADCQELNRRVEILIGVPQVSAQRH